MGRRKGLFGRSKESKQKNAQQQVQQQVQQQSPAHSHAQQEDHVHAAQEFSNTSRRTSNGSSQQLQQAASAATTAVAESSEKSSPLLVAKAKRNSILTTTSAGSKPLLDYSYHSHSNSSGTIFIPVKSNEDPLDTSQSGITSRASQRSLNSSRSKSGGPPLLSIGEPSVSVLPKVPSESSQNGTYSYGRPSSVSSVQSELYFPGTTTEFQNMNRLSSLPPNSNMHMQPPVAGSFIPQPPQFGSAVPNIMRPPPVRLLVEELFRIDNGDFFVAERYLKLLRDALEIEGTAFQNGEIDLSFDPADTFFCIKQVAENFYSRWSDLKESRLGKQDKVEDVRDDNNTLFEDPGVDWDVDVDVGVGADADADADADVDTVAPKMSPSKPSNLPNEMNNDNVNDNEFNPVHIDEDTWNTIEQISWGIFELAMWSCAVLATVWVGPAWQYQLDDRRMRLQSARLQKLRRSTARQNKYETTASLTSSVTLSQSNRQPIQKVSFHRGGDGNGDTSQRVDEQESSMYHQPQYPLIPEVLPISMLQFAATFGDAILPITKDPDTEVILTRQNKGDVDVNDEEDDSEFNPIDYARSIEQIVWEEQRSLIRRQRVGEAQRELAAALTTASGKLDSTFDDATTTGRSISTQSHKRYKWSIPGAHDPVAMMVRSWLKTTLIGWPDSSLTELTPPENFEVMDSMNLEVIWGTIANNGALDWWNAFQVSKSVSDLTQAGWRPPPKGRHGEECVLRLMTLAEKGILLLPHDMKNATRDAHVESREEILAASSTSSEALAALNHLGGRGCLPQTTVKSVARNLCQLLLLTDESILDSSQSLCFVNSSNLPDGEMDQDLEAFMGLRMACLHEIAELLWSMMARNSSMAPTTEALLGAINIDLSSKDIPMFNADIISACGAVRSLGASLWGNPPRVKGNSSLRLCWSLFFELLSETSSSIHDWSQCQKSPVEKTDSTASSSSYTGRINETGNTSLGISFLAIPKLKNAHEYNSLSLNLVLEVAVAIRRLVDGDMASGVDILCLHEWEQLMGLLERGLLPWLATLRTDNSEIHFIEEQKPKQSVRNEDLVQKIQAEVSSIFLQIKVFLSCHDDGAISSHRILHETVRTRFHLLFFRMVSPLLPAAASTHVALSIIDFWMHDEAISLTAFEWQRKCSSLLSEAFAVYEEAECGYDGNYVHSPSVRQAAMRALVRTDRVGPNHDNASLSTLGGSTDLDPYAIARNARSVHTDIVCRLLFPYISEVLHMTTVQNGLQLPVPYPIQKQEELGHEGQLLLLPTVQIIGDLLTYPSLDPREHPQLLKILRTCALDTPTPTRRNASASNGLLGDVLKLNNYGEICKLKLEAVRQLGLYLRASFEARGESRAPDIVSILAEIVQSFYNNAGYQVVASAAMFQLTCIRRKNNGKAMLLDEITVLNSFPPTTIDFNERVMFVMEIISSHKNPDDEEELEKFRAYRPESLKGTVFCSWIHIFVGDEDTDEMKSRKTVKLNLRPLIETIKCVLNANLDQNTTAKSKEISPYLRFITAESDISLELKALCFETLQSFIQCGLVKQPLKQLREITPLMGTAPFSLSQCKLLSCCATFIAKDSDSTLFFRQLLSSCTSNNNLISRVACQALSAYFATVSIERHDSPIPIHNQWHQDACSNLVNTIQSLVGSRQEGVLHIPLLTTLLNVISSYNPMLHSLSDRTKANIVILCHQICSDFSGMCQHTYLLCLQCTSSASATIGMDELRNLVSRISERQESFSHTRSTPEEPEHLHFASVILDILVQHCLSKSDTRRPRRNEREHNPSESKLSEIELVAKDIADIESFEVAPRGGHGAWLCNDLVLICRVGSNESRHRGWVEIILRSPSTRVRKLVRLSNHTSLKHHDLPSNLWDAVLTSQENTNMRIHREPLGAVDVDPPTVDTKVVATAKGAIMRFQRLNDKESHSQSSSLRSFMGFSPEELSTIKTSKSSEHKRQNNEQTSPVPADGGFLNFLYTALLGDEANIREVENALHELDCSIPILDSVYDYSDGPLPLNWDPKLRRAVNVLDRTAYLQTHKVSFREVAIITIHNTWTFLTQPSYRHRLL